MPITMRELRKAGIDIEFIKEVRSFIPRTVDDTEASQYLNKLITVALEDGLVGPSMMREIARMRSNSAVNRGLYSKIIEFKKEAEKRLAKRAAREAKKEADEEVTPKKGKKRKKIEPVAAEPEEEEEEEEPEPETKAPAKRKRKALKPKKKIAAEGEPVMTVDFEYEGYDYRSIQHPDTPAVLKKFDNYWPVDLNKLWKYKTSGPVTFPVFTAKARTKSQHLVAAKRKGVTKAQFEGIWKQWIGKRGRELGWVMEEVEDGKFQLRALDPLKDKLHRFS